MAYRILVALDGSVLAERAIPWADRLAASLAANVALIRAIPPDASREGGDPSPPESVTDAEAALARGALAKANHRFRWVRPREAQVVRGLPHCVIAAEAVARADLVVMTSHGRTGLERAILGSVAAGVVAESGKPVVVIPRDVIGAPRLPRQIVVALDTRRFSAAILPHAASLARSLDSMLVLLGVSTPAKHGRLVDTMRALEEMAVGPRREGLLVELAIRKGPPGPCTVSFAHEHDMDMIAVSTRARQGAARWILSAAAEYILANARRPVLLLCSRAGR